MEHSNVLLVLMCLDMKDSTSPLRSRSGGEVFLVDEDDRYHLLVAVLDPSQRATSAPFMGIKLNQRKRATYNSVLKQFQEISDRFYNQERGFIAEPASYTEAQQIKLHRDLSAVGRDIYDLFHTETVGSVPSGRLAIHEWLDKLLGSSETVRNRQRPTMPVTILTNDFGIPWFWLKRERNGPFLCEVCSLGLLQLSAMGRGSDVHQSPPGQKDKTYEALLINGSTTLPFQDEELDRIASLLGDFDQRAARTFTPYRAKSTTEIHDLVDEVGGPRLRDDFRIVHFSGHYSGDKLELNGRTLNVNSLHDMLYGSLLVLDGCNSGGNLNAWADVEGLTSTLINQGAIGCVVTVLPVKHDPIVSKILWGTFYQELRRGSNTIGQSLTKARNALRDHYKAIGSNDPSWAIYQLIGSPAVQLCDQEGEQ